MHTTTEILIIGGGIAGCITAIALADTHQVTLIDKRATPIDRIGESLAPAAQRILQRLRLLEELSPEQQAALFVPSLGMQSYWGREQVQIVDHLRNPDGLGRNLDRRAFESYLRKVAQARGVTCRWATKLFRSSYEKGHWQILVQANGKEPTQQAQIQADFVIDASGRQSHFARGLGIKRHAYDKLLACWLTLPNLSPERMSLIASCESGWWYSAPIPHNKRVVSFQTDSDLIAKSALKKEPFLSLALQQKQIGKFLEMDPELIEFRGTVSANSTRLEQVVGTQWLALGDAAISFDPLSSQGMFHAMASALQFHSLIADCSPDPRKWGEAQRKYAEQVEKIWEKYLQNKRLYYRTERRWEQAPFWQRRQT